VTVGECFAFERVSDWQRLAENVPIGAAQSQLECYRAYARLRREADVLVPGYDPDVLERDGGVLA
jgi:hypothetical protein